MDTKEKQQQQPQKATKSLFDGGLYSNVHPLHDSNSFRRQSPSLPSSDSCATSMSQTSESRRNSNEGLDKEEENEESGLCSVFDKLNTEEFEERRNSSPGGKAEDDFVKPYHRSMSVDVGSMQRKLPLSASSSCSTRHGAGSLGDGAGSNNIHDLLSRSLLFDNKSDLPSFPATPQAPRNDPYLRRYAGSTEKLSSLANKDKGYNGIFPSSSALDLPSSLRRNSARHNKSVESLRSESWAQYLENAEGTFAAPVSADDSLPDARAQAAFIGQQRRFSYNWPDMGNGKYNHLPANMKFKNGNNRLTTSHSYSDLHDAALRSYYAGSAQQQQQQHMTAGSMHDAMLAAAAAADNLEIPCPQYQQHGFCVMDNHCPYSHNAALSQPALMDHNAAAAAAATTGGLPPPHPLGLPALPFYSSLYQQYAMLNNLTPNASPAFSMKAAAAAAALLNANLAPGQRLPTDIRPNNNNNNSGSNNSSRKTSQATTPVPPNEEPNRFAGARLEEFRGKIYDLCKDQNGCRFLQKKLEEPNRQQLELIFEEVQPHFVELMTEPFGNYLCQKLIEHCDDAQRDILVDTVAPDLLKISLNMHGTRAVQRFIEFLSTPQQIHAVTVALKPNVVTLIKDLNGNHVIQKCLHRLSAEHKQFIYDAVSEHCIQVATHRHGCCVLQRCIDYASDAQKDQLVKVITWHALPLVQDPFGNYVVQYVLDLGDIHYTDTLVRCFLEHVCDLSVQKFSSNVIEKCIRVAEPETRRLLVAELMNEANIEKLLRDSFANYVIQTCLEYADQDQRLELVEAIRPLLPSIRSTPCGKRIHSKIQREQPQRAQQQQQQQQQQMQHPPRLRQQQSLGSLRLSNNAGAFGNTSSSSMYSNGTNSLAFGLPLIGNNTFYPYP